VLKGTDCTGTCTFVNPTIIRSRPWQSRPSIICKTVKMYWPIGQQLLACT
jgi:hypothetical protein